jgi:hypothetical protein
MSEAVERATTDAAELWHVELWCSANSRQVSQGVELHVRLWLIVVRLFIEAPT